MRVKVEDTTFDLDASAVGGVLRDMSEEGYETIDFDRKFSSKDFEMFLKCTDVSNLDLASLANAYKIAHFLQAEARIAFFARELSSRIKSCDRSELNEILSCFDK